MIHIQEQLRIGLVPEGEKSSIKGPQGYSSFRMYSKIIRLGKDKDTTWQRRRPKKANQHPQ